MRFLSLPPVRWAVINGLFLALAVAAGTIFPALIGALTVLVWIYAVLAALTLLLGFVNLILVDLANDDRYIPSSYRRPLQDSVPYVLDFAYDVAYLLVLAHFGWANLVTLWSVGFISIVLHRSIRREFRRKAEELSRKEDELSNLGVGA